MATPRRRVVRPLAVAAAAVQHRQRRSQALRSRLTKDRCDLDRWMGRLRRAFHAVEKLQRRIAHADRQLTRLEND
jgi:hypothetical protein